MTRYELRRRREVLSGCPYYAGVSTPDCNYRDAARHSRHPLHPRPCRTLPGYGFAVSRPICWRLPAGSTVTLNWGDVGNPNSGNPTIDLFKAADADGGIGYLTNETICRDQTNIIPIVPTSGGLAPGRASS